MTLKSAARQTTSLSGEPRGLLRVACYYRVSTLRQGEEGVSLDSQRNGARKLAKDVGGTIVREYQETKSASDADKRPVFQQMIREACSPEHPFDIIIFHSTSRAFRNEIDFTLYTRKLTQHGVKVRFKEQDFPDTKEGRFASRLVALVDEHLLEGISEHVKHSMKENARQGFSNGSTPPLGLVAKPCDEGRWGDKIKKKWVIDESSAEIVRKIFAMCVGGWGYTRIRDWLNDHHKRTPRGKKFYTGTVEKILKNEVYIGRAAYDKKNHKAGTPRPREEWVWFSVPRIISDEVFHRAQAQIAKRRPEVTAPRITTSNVILGGICFCEVCKAPMKIRTGTSKTGKKFRYYACSKHLMLRDCPGGTSTTINADNADRMVLNAVLTNVLTPKRLQALTAEVFKLRDVGRGEALQSLALLKKQLTAVNQGERRLIAAIEEGLMADGEAIRARSAELKAERERLLTLIEAQTRAVQEAIQPITLPQAEVAVRNFRTRLSTSPPAIRKRYLQSIVGQVLVGPERVQILGAKSAIAEALNRDFKDAPPLRGVVRVFDREWWPRQESNLQPAA